jgi:hypothetical protein
MAAAANTIANAESNGLGNNREMAHTSERKRLNLTRLAH